jgi:uncharacterized protein YjdB
MRSTTLKQLSTWMMTLALTACGTAVGSLPGGSASVPLQIQVTPPTNSMAAGLKQKLVATGVYQDGRTADLTGQVRWTTSDASIATVDGNGLVTGASAGRVQVQASLLDRTAEAQLDVTAATLLSMELVSQRQAVPLGVAVSVVARGHLSDGTDVDLTSQVAWAVPVGGLDVVLPGQLRTVAMGSARVAASFQGSQAVLDVEVTSAEPTDLHVRATRNLASLPKGASASLAAVAGFTDDSESDVTGDVIWHSSDPTVAAVEDGRLLGVAMGTAQLEATFGGQSITVDVTVTSAELIGLAVSPPVATVPLGSSVHLTALGYYSDGATADLTDEVTWTSQYPLNVQTSNAPGHTGDVWGLLQDRGSVVSAELPGGGLIASSYVEVGPAGLLGYSLDYATMPAPPTVAVGRFLTLRAMANFTNGSTEISPYVTWESRSPGVATVAGGVVSGVGPGLATIVATSNNDPAVVIELEVTVTY